MPARTSNLSPSVKSPALSPVQLFWLAGAVFAVSAGYGALMPLLPGWLTPLMPDEAGSTVARHIGLLSGAYAAGVLLGAPLWGRISDRAGRSRILIIGLTGYIASNLLLLLPALADAVEGIYALRGMAGFFVAAVVPVVSALVAEHTPADHRARRFAWMSGVSLLGFLFGPAMKVVADAAGASFSSTGMSAETSTRYVLFLSALLGGVMMLGLARTLPKSRPSQKLPSRDPVAQAMNRPAALLWLNGGLLFVLAAFELGIVLLGQQQAGQSSRQAAIMFAECSLVMLTVNAVLFFTALLEKISPRILIGIGLIVAMVGLGVMAMHSSETTMFLGVGLTSVSGQLNHLETAA